MSEERIFDVQEEGSRGSVEKSWSLGSQGASHRPTSSARVEDSEERGIEEFVERILGGEFICKGALYVLKVPNSGTRITRVAKGSTGKHNDARILTLVQSRADTSQLFINKLYSEPDGRVSRTWKLRDLSSISVYHNPTETAPQRSSELSLTMDRRVYRFRVPSSTYCRKFIGLLQDNCKFQYGKIPNFHKNRPLRLFVVPAALRPGNEAGPVPGTSKERDTSESGQWPTRDASTTSSASPSPQLVRSFEMLDLRNTVLANQSTTPGQVTDEEELSRLRERERLVEDRERLRLSEDDMEALNDVLNLMQYDWKTSSGTLLQRIRVARGVLEMEAAADVLANDGLSSEMEQLGQVARQIEEACQPPSGGSYNRIVNDVSEKIEAHKIFLENVKKLYENVNKVVESTTLDEQEKRLVLDLKNSEGNLFDNNQFVLDAEDILCRSLLMKLSFEKSSPRLQTIAAAGVGRQAVLDSLGDVLDYALKSLRRRITWLASLDRAGSEEAVSDSENVRAFRVLAWFLSKERPVAFEEIILTYHSRASMRTEQRYLLYSVEMPLDRAVNELSIDVETSERVLSSYLSGNLAISGDNLERMVLGCLRAEFSFVSSLLDENNASCGFFEVPSSRKPVGFQDEHAD
ncbi:hypothetical protein NDN08_000631 [Rhodosorus marinus]|uniref:Exocyst complex component Sec3 PIP2-binding N-terminal domain-containing protein n=1 Tax=Rhodosorus marinus TaxID=101924 RepID=A0AAV8USN9_9RHOD|nr:hypothetical protein NDN08_000631 [Rhodosorus marinus]